jgi:(5-formylfuran-3-yl)methyl phosphate synthase
MTKFLGIAANESETEAFRKGGADAVSGEAFEADVVVDADSADAIAQCRKAKRLLWLKVSAGFGGRLLDAQGIPELARIVADCRDRGAAVALSGRLEPPDVPRLLPLKPDYLGFEGPLAPEAIAVLRALIPSEGARPGRDDLRILSARGHAPGDGGDYDKLIVRDFVIDMSVGAYAFEHAKPQRVKFDVVAEVRRRTTAPKDMRDVFSYDIIMDTIRTAVTEGHVDLLETLADKISRRLLGHPDIAVLHLKLEKLDLGPAIVGVEITRKRAVESAKVRQLYKAGAETA